MSENNKEIIEENDFEYKGVNYTARLYKMRGRSSTYGEIVYANSKERVPNMKGLVREILKPNGIEISTDANKINTHQAIKILIEHLGNEENLGTGEFGNGTGSLADRIRLYCVANKIEPARKLKATNVTISASDIHKEMNLSNRFPAVCQVLSGKKIRKMANIKIVREIDDNPSSRYAVVYEIL